MLDTWEFRAILEKGKALNPLRLKASEMAPPVGLEPTTLSVRNIVALLAWGARNARCFFLLRAPLHLPQAARCSEPWHDPRPIFKAFNLNKKWNRSLRSRWNNLLCKLWYLPLRIKWNEIKPHRRSDFTRRRRISRPQGISQIPKGIYFVKKSTCKCKCFFHGGHARTRTVDLLRVKQAL